VTNQRLMLITGDRKGIGRYLVEYYLKKNYRIIGCSRKQVDFEHENFFHYSLDITDESKVRSMFSEIRRTYGRLDILINNAGIASMNHVLLTPMETAQKILNTNIAGTFLFCREAIKLMKKNKMGRIVNFATVASPLKLQGEAIYASSKAAVINFSQVLAKEIGGFGITVNVVGPTPIKTDLIRKISDEKLNAVISNQAVQRFGEFQDISNVIDFFIQPESDFITGQVIYLGGV
jgi:3-oxoacyl-[acyl-carrier protein] reductase